MYLDVKNALAFYAEVVLNQAPFNYTCADMDLVNPNFYNQWATVVWSDIRPQPTDSELFTVAPQYMNWLRSKDLARTTALENGKFDKPTGTTSQYIRGNGTLATLPNGVRTFTNPTRSLNSSFQISTTQDAQVSYAVDVTTALSLTGGQAGTVYLRYADDSGFTTNVKEVGRFASSNTGALTIGLALNQIATGTLSGLIPSGKYVRLVTESNTGSPTFTYRSAQEVLL